MNATKTISIIVLATAAAWAQATTKPVAKTSPATKAAATKPASQTAPAKTAPTAKTAAAAGKSIAPAKTATTAKTTTTPAKTATPKTTTAAKTAVKTAPTAAKKPTARASAKAVTAKTAPVKAAATSIAPVKPIGKRDPFVSVIVARADSTAACSGGKRCLVVDQLALRGIVRTPTKWIALVENPARKTYYLYENDPISNAVVVRITGDSVIFRENIMDALGHSTEREVVKRVNAPAI
jgi:hypothetical protein